MDIVEAAASAADAADQTPRLSFPGGSEVMTSQQANTHTSREEGLERRDFLKIVISGIAAFIAAAAGIPIVGYVLSPALRRTRTEWTQLGPEGDFPIGVPRLVPFTRFRRDGWIERPENLSVWVWRESQTELVVYNGHCTHLGCAFNWMTSGKHEGHFFCPCHDGVYDIGGTVIGGPPPRPLDRLETKVEDGKLFVVYQDFRLGVPEKVPA
jgi:menaquinol-cytochrome c reductase iron-sulfur subunit